MGSPADLFGYVPPESQASDADIGLMPSRNPMVWLHGFADGRLTCSGCRFLIRGKHCRCSQRPRFASDHNPTLPACGRYDPLAR